MGDINLDQYSDKRSYNNLPVPEGQYLAPFLVHNWDEVKAMNYHRENLDVERRDKISGFDRIRSN